jgi:hypothetical protein
VRTPAKQDCPYYYEDFTRGADIRQCRIARTRESEPWNGAHCGRCPVPGIYAASGSALLDLTLTVRSGPFGRKPKFTVDAWCVMHGPIEDPFVGCLECTAPLDIGE